MRLKGGFILIHINKLGFDNISVDDLEEYKPLFREIIDKNIKKPLIIEFNKSLYLIPFCNIDGSFLSYFYSQVYVNEGAIVSADSAEIIYNKATDEITYNYGMYEQ